MTYPAVMYVKGPDISSTAFFSLSIKFEPVFPRRKVPLKKPTINLKKILPSNSYKLFFKEVVSCTYPTMANQK